MKRIVLAVVFSLASFEASAIVRYMIQDMTCAEIQAAIERDGAAILFRKSASGVSVYDRYVADQTFCPAGNIISQDSVPAADTGRCRVNRCIEASRFSD